MARTQGLFRIVCRIFAYGGLALLGFAAILLLRTLTIVANGERTEGTVVANVWSTDSETNTACAVVRFVADGKTVEFTSPVGTNPPLHKVGDTVTVFYAPGHPEDAVIEGFAERYLRPIVASGFGLVFLAVGGGSLWGPAWFARRRQRIISEGVPVQATVTTVRKQTHVQINDQSPWVIVAEFKDEMTGQTVSCRSHYLWTDPAVEYPAGSTVTVYYLQDRPHKHAFDLDKLRQEGD